MKNQRKEVQFNETVVFNVTSPEDFVAENDIKLSLTVMNSNVLSDSVLGFCEISVLPLFVNFENGNDYQLYYQKKKKDAKEKSGIIHVDIRFRPAKRGYLVVHCIEGKKLKNMEMMGKQDPYIKFELLGQKPKRTKTIKDGGTDCSFNNEEVRLYIDVNTWTQKMIVSCFDEDIGSDDLIGAHKFNLLDLMSDASNIEQFEAEGMGRVHEEFYEIFQGKKLDKPAGQVKLRLQFFPAGTLSVKTIAGRHLVDKDSMGKQDPYIVYYMKSDFETSNFKVKTKTDKDGGSDPLWDEISTFHVVDHHQLVMEAYDEDTLGSDDMIGKASFSLLPVFRKGIVDTWVTLRNKDKWGRVTKCGEIHLELDYKAPPGVGYPLLQPDMDTFDDSERENKPKGEEEEEEKGPGSDEPGGTLNLSKEFSDADIEAAFNFIDLNQNKFIGAGELRHILVCMGELITDEEVDEMIRMVDGDGDGQVSFEEFYALMVHPDPAAPDFNTKSIVQAVDAPVAIGHEAKDIAARREQEAAAKKEKIRLMRLFSESNEVGMTFLQRAFDKFKLIDRGAGGTGFVDFPVMCDVLTVEPVGEYKKMFKMLDYSQSGSINMRELLLGLSNFSGAQKEARCNFCFTLFDEDGNGTLNTEELTEILKANHLVSDEKAVKRKVETIMKQCDEDGSGSIDRDEFFIIARKFPTMLFPEYR